jgi:peptidoglycan/LPS O-acetylase OafA/YrhL
VQRFGHVPELDGIRAVAVGLVFIGHVGLGHIVPGGIGVTIFFFLSGYLITSLMIDEVRATGGFSIKNFYVRRSLRILPPMWIAMAIAIGLAAVGLLKTHVSPTAVLSQLVFLTNYTDLWHDSLGAPGIPLWSLAVEEHFYLLFPWTFAGFFLQMNPRRAALWCLGACMVFLAMRVATYVTTDMPNMIYYRSHLRMDSILFGCCLAFWRNPVLDPETAYRPGYVAAALAVVAMLATLLIRNDMFRETLRYSAQGAALYVLYAFVLGRQTFVNRILKAEPMQIIGRYSYVIYLLHVPFYQMIEQNLPSQNALIIGVLTAALTLAVAAILNQLVERPLARLRKSFAAKT